MTTAAPVAFLPPMNVPPPNIAAASAILDPIEAHFKERAEFYRHDLSQIRTIHELMQYSEFCRRRLVYILFVYST